MLRATLANQRCLEYSVQGHISSSSLFLFSLRWMRVQRFKANMEWGTCGRKAYDKEEHTRSLGSCGSRNLQNVSFTSEREEDDSPGVFQNRSSSGALGIVIPGGPDEPSDTPLNGEWVWLGRRDPLPSSMGGRARPYGKTILWTRMWREGIPMDLSESYHNTGGQVSLNRSEETTQIVCLL